MSSSELDEIVKSDHENRSSCWDTFLPCDPTRRCHRYLILFLICFLVFGNLFCYDNPLALEDKIMSDMSLSATAYMGFYSWASWPNVVLSFIGGFLIDRVFGVRLGALIFALLVTAGQVIFAWGAYVNNYVLAVFGRFVFGVGSDNLNTAQSTYSSLWFRDTELNFVFGVQLTVPRVSSILNLNVMDPMYNAMSGTGHRRLGSTLFVASLACFLSVVCAITLALFDRRAQRILQRQTKKTEAKGASLGDIRNFPIGFWLTCGICVSYYTTVHSFISLSKIFIIHKYNKSPEQAVFTTSLIYIVSVICSPIIGFLIGRTGKNLFWILGGTVLALGCQILLAFTFLDSFILIILLGLSLSVLICSMLPVVILVIPQHQRATAFGILESIQNLILAVTSIVAGIIQDKFGFLILNTFFCICLCFSIMFVVLLYLWDIQNDSRLNESGKSRRRKHNQSEVCPTINT